MSVDHKVINELLALAKKQNKEDVLLHVKEAFLIPENVIYVDGNSLGPLTKKAKERALAVVEQQWGNSLIASWNDAANDVVFIAARLSLFLTREGSDYFIEESNFIPA